MKTWMIRAGIKGRFFETLKQESKIAIGWRGVGDLLKYKDRKELVIAVSKAYPAYKEQQSLMAASQLFRFCREFNVGDRAVTYDSGSRSYLCGTITGNYVHVPNAQEEEFENTRSVTWSHETPRDQLSEGSKNSLGSISTIFQITATVSFELWGEAKRIKTDPEPEAAPASEIEDDDELSLQAVSEKASETIKDILTKLSGHEMEQLVAGILRAMGYQTRISPRGPDRGADIIASPDGFGFQEPRIVVEVKHRPGQRMGAPEIRSFLGGRHQRDKGLYVSTGGFTNEARYEADRAAIPVTTWDFGELTETMLRNYDALDQETKQLIPLRPIYWPIV